MATIRDLRAALDAAVSELPSGEVPDAIGLCASAQARMLARIAMPPAPTVVRDELVDAAEMARRVGLPEHHLRDRGRRWLRTQGREGLPAVKHGRYMRFQPTEVIAAIRRNRMASPEQPEKANKGAGWCPPVSTTKKAGDAHAN